MKNQDPDYTINKTPAGYHVDPETKTFDLSRPIEFFNNTGDKIRLRFKRKDGKAGDHCFDGDIDIDPNPPDNTKIVPRRATKTMGVASLWKPKSTEKPDWSRQTFDINF